MKKLILTLLTAGMTAHAGMMKLGGGGFTYTANQYGVALSSANNSTITILAPDASTTKVLTSGGASANPSWQEPTGDIAGVTAGTGISGGGTSGTVTVNALMHTNGIVNCSIDATVSANALTIHIKGADGNALSASNPCVVTFRSATATSGTQSQVSFTSASTVVVPDTATLGCTVSTACALYVYAFNDAGMGAVAVTGWKILDEGAVASTTAVGSGSDTLGTLYSTSGITNKAARLLGEVVITLAASEHWSNAATTIKNVPFEWYGSALTAYTPSITHNSGSMTNATTTGLWQRVRRDRLYARGHTTFTGAGGTWSRYYSSLPPGCTVDTAKHLDNSGGGTSYNVYGQALYFDASGADSAGFVRYSEDNTKVLVNVYTIGATYVQTADLQGTVPYTWASGDDIDYFYEVFCTGWSG